MEDFNENPFKADTKVMVFSCGSEGADWTCANCDKCIKRGKCDIEAKLFDADYQGPYGYLPLHMAKRVGIDYNPLYQQGSIVSKCHEFRDGTEPF